MYFFFRFISMSNFFRRPPCPRSNAWNFRKISDYVRLGIPLFPKIDSSLLQQTLVGFFCYSPASSRRWFVDCPIWCYHLIILFSGSMAFLSRHWHGTPTSVRVVVRVSIYLCLLFSHRNKITYFFESPWGLGVNVNILMNVTDGFTIFTRIPFLPNV